MITNRLQEVRAQKGLTQAELGQKLGVTQGAVAQFEKSQSLNTATLMSISDALGCSPVEIIPELSRVAENDQEDTELPHMVNRDDGFTLVPVSWLKDIEKKLDQLLEAKRPDPEETGPTLTAAEAAVYMNIDRNTLYRWTRENRVPHRKVGGKLFFYKGEIDAWMMEGMK